MKWYDGFNRYIIGMLPILVPLYVIAIALQLVFSNVVMYMTLEDPGGWVDLNWLITSLTSFLGSVILAGVVLVLIGILLELKTSTK